MAPSPSHATIPKTCALCLREADLRASHIIPEFAYKPAYDEKHRMHAIPGHAPDENFLLQKGFRYPLLCERCEAFLNTNYEDPFKRFWVDGQQLARMRAGHQNIIRNIDYAKFKLFHLSVLWRAAVCRHPAFHCVSLGPHTERIRNMLLAEDAGPSSRYPIVCGIVIHDDDGSICDSLISTPLSLRMMGGHRGFTFVFCGCQWIYVVSSHATPEVGRIQLSDRGEMIVDATSFKQFCRDFYGASRMPSPGSVHIDARHLLPSVPHHHSGDARR